jgi:hypothetical protein
VHGARLAGTAFVEIGEQLLRVAEAGLPRVHISSTSAIAARVSALGTFNSSGYA